jgi:alkylation response protein AidB-like acyl-CoA dehydrogenase
MDFSFSEEQDAVKELAAQILDGQLGNDALKAFDKTDEPYDAGTWAEFAKAGLLGIALPESGGGAGLGFTEVALVLEQIGRAAAPVPYRATVVLGARPIAEFGTDAQKDALLPGVVEGESLLTAALVEFGTSPGKPSTTARPEGDGWRLDGSKLCVPIGLQADRILVPAATGEGTVGVFIVDPSATGVSQEALLTTSGQPETRLDLDGVIVGAGDVLGDPTAGAAIVEWMVEHATAAGCAAAIGVCAEALRLTAEYTKTREQFERPIATFQAVGQRAADAYIDTEAVRLTAWQAVWRLDQGLPATEAVAIAKFWTAEGGQRVVHAAQHLHGGMGVDRDYPLHRYFLWAKQIELTLGGGTQHLLELGKILADEPV